MASRRLKRDRCFTTEYTPRVDTQPGLDWIATNTVVSLLGRYVPDRRGVLADVANRFAPWPRSAASAQRKRERWQSPVQI
jgi:hypothetical protein